MHQNKIPRPAENRIIRIGDGAVFLIFLQIRCVAPSMANTAIERKSGANPACKSVRPNSVDSAMLSAVARIIATTHGRTPDKKALTGAYFIRFFSADAIKRIIKNNGNTTPSVATNEPRIPPSVDIRYAQLLPAGIRSCSLSSDRLLLWYYKFLHTSLL